MPSEKLHPKHSREAYDDSTCVLSGRLFYIPHCLKGRDPLLHSFPASCTPAELLSPLHTAGMPRFLHTAGMLTQPGMHAHATPVVAPLFCLHPLSHLSHHPFTLLPVSPAACSSCMQQPVWVVQTI